MLVACSTAGHLHSTVYSSLPSSYTTSYTAPLHQTYVAPAANQLVAPTYVSPQAYGPVHQTYYSPAAVKHQTYLAPQTYIAPSAKHFVAPVHQSYVAPQAYVVPQTYVAPAVKQVVAPVHQTYQAYYTPAVKQLHQTYLAPQTYVTPAVKQVYSSYSAPIYQEQHYHQIQHESSPLPEAGSNAYLPSEQTDESYKAPVLPLEPTAEASASGEDNRQQEINESYDNNDSEVVETRKAKNE